MFHGMTCFEGKKDKIFIGKKNRMIVIKRNLDFLQLLFVTSRGRKT